MDFVTFLAKAITAIFSKGDGVSVSAEIPLDNEKPTSQPEQVVYKITKDELLMGRDTQYPLDYTQQISDNLDRLLVPLNKIRDAYGKPMKATSGWRPPSINNSTPGAAKASKHMQGLAADFSDPNGDLLKWVLENLQLMKDLGIYMEDFRWTPTWVHFQLGSPTSGRRIFIPNTMPPIAPSRWNGNYDSSFNG